jgi:hypothetical protein
MNILLPLIVLVILAVLYAGTVNNARTRLYVVIAVLVIVFGLCWLELRPSNRGWTMGVDDMNWIYEGFQSGSGLGGYAPLDYTMRVADSNPNMAGSAGSVAGSCDGYNYQNLNSLISPLGTYDGIRLPSKIDTVPLMGKVFITSPVGDDIQLTQDPASKNFPTVDGTPNTDKHLFVFANNNRSPFCHSQYSTSEGQVCLDQNQVNLFMGRGKNLTAPQEYPNM